jgi:outer membrane lipoprotein-sorting protein
VKTALVRTAFVTTAAAVLAALVLGIAAAPSARQGADPLDDLFARGRAAQAGIKTLTASFTETTVSSLLRDPIVATGTLVAAMPLRVVMTYKTPTPKTVALDTARLVVDWPARKVHETLDIRTTQERIQKYFTSASTKELRELFTIALTQEAESYRLDMVPKRKQIAEGLERLRLWVDRASLTLVRMTLDHPGGDSRTLELSAVRTNVAIDESAFAPLAQPGKGRR